MPRKRTAEERRRYAEENGFDDTVRMSQEQDSDVARYKSLLDSGFSG